ncbi:MAG: hypothetical protein A2V66_07370 [Ignavibacteria bacterium RBG_13_36_8]|nr:MAG: hypothetical protein A2V66_07370 [Ignavibacteria bacterium RBG_13_36_8]
MHSITKLILLTIIISFTACKSPTHEMTEEEKDTVKEAVLTIHNNTVEMAKQADLEKTFEAACNEYGAGYINNGVMYNDIESMKAFIKPSFDKIEKQEISFDDVRVSVVAQNAALLTAHGNFIATLKDGSQFGFPFAWTFVYVKLNDQWRVIHTHQSFEITPSS